MLDISIKSLVDSKFKILSSSSSSIFSSNNFPFFLSSINEPKKSSHYTFDSDDNGDRLVLKGPYREKSEKPDRLTNFISSTFISSVAWPHKFFFERVLETRVYGREKLNHLVLNRSNDRSLLTFGNHLSILDAATLACPMPWSIYWTSPEKLMSIYVARDMLFSNPLFRAFFSRCRLMPLTRGGGVEQDDILVGVKKLNAHEWVHLFPEGRVTRTGELGPIKFGISRILLEVEDHPILLPIYAHGIDAIKPVGTFIPTLGHTIRILIADPISVQDIRQAYYLGAITKEEAYNAIAERIRDVLLDCKRQMKDIIASESIAEANQNKNFF